MRALHLGLRVADLGRSLEGYGAADDRPGFWGLEGPAYLARLEMPPHCG